MLNDVRILSLYKQHYMDCYRSKLVCQYSCWGYYDGIDVDQAVTGAEHVSVSDLWSAAGHKISSVTGGFSCQTIGVFLHTAQGEREKRTQQFWESEKDHPFFAVAFLQLADSSQYEQMGEKIEAVGEEAVGEGSPAAEETDAIQEKEICQVAAYCTFDNADLVVFLHSNSMYRLHAVLEEIDNLPEVTYTHPILGVAEAYLTDCNQAEKILASWRRQYCFLDQPVAQWNLQIASSGKRRILQQLKYVLDQVNDTWQLKGYDTASWSYTAGHENVVVSIRGTDVRSMLVLLLPDGAATHQNPLYEDEMYNLKTWFLLKENAWGQTDAMPFTKAEDSQHNRHWCNDLITKYEGDVKEKLDHGKNDSLCSYYLAMIQTLNTLAQYEQFGLSSNIFDLVFPAFLFFSRQLEDALHRAGKSPDYYAALEGIKGSIRSFLTSVTSVMYHTIHTDQMFLMIPGYSGTAFSIPVKLILMYLWLVDKLIEVLNDGKNTYCSIVTPVMEAKPETRAIDFGLDDHRNRLICIRLSQRSLYQPHSLTLILAHEIAHYVGQSLRNRTARTKIMLQMVVYAMVEGIIPDIYSSTASGDVQKEMEKYLHQEFKQDLQRHISRSLSRRFADGSLDFYANDLSERLQKDCHELLASEASGIHRELYRIPEPLFHMLSKSDPLGANLSFLHDMQHEMNENRKTMLAEGVLGQMIQKLMQTFREVFADVVSVCLLDGTIEDYDEGYCVSEGLRVDAAEFEEMQQFRRKVLSGVFGWNEDGVQWVKKDRGIPALEKYLFAYNWCIEGMIEYAKLCKDDIETRILSNGQVKAAVQEIRDFHALFDPRGRQPNDQVYREITQKIYQYRQAVDVLYRENAEMTLTDKA